MLEEIIYEYLSEHHKLNGRIAEYNGVPAVFNRSAPSDVADDWSAVQFPRIVFYISRRDDAENDVSGTLDINIYCHNLNSETPEELSETIKAAIDGYIFTSDSEIVSVQWLQTYYDTNPQKEISAAALSFGFLAFPKQNINHPDYIGALNYWAKWLLPNSTVIGLDTTPKVFCPSNLSPAIYFRSEKVSPCSYIPSTYAGTWYTAEVRGHIFAPDFNIRSNLAQSMLCAMNKQKCLRLDDDTLMRIDHMNKVVPGSDEYRTGEILSECTYCVLNIKPNAEKLNKIYINERRTRNGDK